MPRMFAVQLRDEPAERYENWVNTPVYTHDYEECVGWLGCELPDSGHSCEFAGLAGDGAVYCQSSAEINSLRDENARLRELVQELWPLAYWYTSDLSELDKAKDLMRELGIEV